MLSPEILQSLTSEVGFDDCGIAPAHRLDDDALFMDDWLRQGLHGNMSYLERNRALRYDPCQLVPGAQTVVVCVLTYAHSGHDYHRAIKSRLYELEARLIEQGYITSSDEQNKFCDSAPFLERRWAVEAGLGFIGRNHQFIHSTLGSYVHLGELVLKIPVERPTACNLLPTTYNLLPTTCNDCTRCIDACPGHALGQPQWDATKCIAYITHKCTVCQDVCPLNNSNL